MTTVRISGGTTMVTLGSGATQRVTLDRRTVSQITTHRPRTVVAAGSPTVGVTSQTTNVTVGSAMGVQGPQGLDGADGGQSVTRVAATALGGHRVVRSTSANGAGYASADNADHGDDTIGVTTGAAAESTEIEVQRTGSITFNGWSWTPGLPVFLSTNGALTQTAPDSTHAFSQVIGHAEAADTLFIQIEPPIYY